MDEKNLKNIEMIFNELKKSYKKDKISKDHFINEAKQLGFKDSSGNSWRFNGEWFSYQDGAWTKGDPYEIPPEIKEEIKPIPPQIKINHAEKTDKPTKKKKSYKKNILIPIFSIILLIFLIVILVKNSKQNPNDSNAVEENNKNAPSIKPQENKVKPKSDAFQFSPEQLIGTASFLPEDNEKDSKEVLKKSKISAIVDSFLRRVRIIHGVQISQKNQKISQKCQGSFLGFTISQTLIKEADQIITNQISLQTPSQAKIIIKNNKLFSVGNLNLTRLLDKIKAKGLDIKFEEDQTKQQIIANLIIVKQNLFPVNLNFLINHNSVGKISLGEPIQNVEELLPQGYFVIKRRIQNKYDGYKTYSFHKVYNAEKQPMFIISSNEKVVLKVQIENENYQTSKGLKIGDNLGKLRAFYPELFITVVENQIPYAFIQDSNIRFYLQLNKIIFEEKIFPMDTKIVSIWLERNE